MSSIIITPSNTEELELLTQLLAKMKIKNHLIDQEEVEDLLLGLSMKDVNRSDKIEASTILSQINSKL